jgi:hypothetical protein
MTRPLRSTRITGLHSYHGAVRPCAAHRYSAPRGFGRLRISRPRPTAGSTATGRPRAHGDRFPRSTPEPRPSSRRLHAGHHLTNQQAPVRLNPGATALPRFRCHLSRFDTSSAVHSRSPSWPTPDALKGAPFPQRSAPRLLTDAPCGGLQPPPAGRLRRTTNPKAGPSISDAAPHPELLIFYIAAPSAFVVTQPGRVPRGLCSVVSSAGEESLPACQERGSIHRS